MSLTALEGQGGIGKTRLALEYVRQHGSRAFLGGVFWFSGEQDAESQFHEMLCQLTPGKPWPELAEMRQQGPDAVRDTFARELERLGERVLWVVDNLPEPAEGNPVDLDDWRLELGCLSILFTTRAQVLFGAGGVTSLTVPSLDEKAAVDMLLANQVRALSDEQRKHAKTIVEAVGRLPLALEILAVELKFVSLQRLASDLTKKESSDVVDRAMERLKNQVTKGSLRGVVKTLVRSYERLDHPTRELAHLLACFGPEAIPRSLVEALAGSTDQLQDNLCTLQMRHFLTGQDPEEGVIGQMHRVLASFLRQANQNQRGALTQARDALLRDWEKRGDDGISRERGTLEPHVEAWCMNLSRAVSQEGIEADQDDANLWLGLGIQWLRNGSYRQAKSHQERAYAFVRQILGEHHPYTLASMDNLALVLRALGDFEQTKELQERAYAFVRQILGEHHPNTLTVMNNLASTHQLMGDFEQAKELQERAYAFARQILGEHHPSTLTSMNNLASTLHATGDLEQAKELQERVLVARRQILKKHHPSTLTSMNNLAGTLQTMGELEQARMLHEEVLVARRLVLGEHHPETLTSMNNLALVLYAMGDFEQAKELHEEALEVGRQILTEHHPNILTSKHNLALVLQTMGHLNQAQKLHEEALVARRLVLGERHPHTLTSMNNLASTLRAMGEPERARELMEQRQALIDDAS